ncbi:helix-turn-helix transcriptional regulator [Sphingomonas sp. LR55]|uniref:helix-turn-helix transcriptional regulator n=1 Tax=Sphingomonas sp. LR55 TaxID=3050231 RepID=UPI002FE3D053
MNTERIIRRPEVERIVGLSRSGIYAAMSRNEFPKPRKIGRRAVGWYESHINKWVLTREIGEV